MGKYDDVELPELGAGYTGSLGQNNLWVRVTDFHVMFSDVNNVVTDLFTVSGGVNFDEWDIQLVKDVLSINITRIILPYFQLIVSTEYEIEGELDLQGILDII